jgi:hypothetical protein
MKKMIIYEPAMCCPTGLCGVEINPELLRISTVLNALKNHGVEVVRYNLSNSPQEFVKNEIVNNYINNKGVEGLPITVLDNQIIITGRYPTNEEFSRFLNVPVNYLGNVVLKKKSGGGDCKGGCC